MKKTVYSVCMVLVLSACGDDPGRMGDESVGGEPQEQQQYDEGDGVTNNNNSDVNPHSGSSSFEDDGNMRQNGDSTQNTGGHTNDNNQNDH